MARILNTIVDHIVKIRKKDTCFIEFNSTHAKIALDLPMENKRIRWFEEQYINWEKREEFLQFMEENLPHIKLSDVFDNLPSGYIEYPYLGTIAIDMDIESPDYHIVNSHYEDEAGQPYDLNAILWIMPYEQALESYQNEKLHD
jgi:hypothetical protein